MKKKNKKPNSKKGISILRQIITTILLVTFIISAVLFFVTAGILLKESGSYKKLRLQHPNVYEMTEEETAQEDPLTEQMLKDMAARQRILELQGENPDCKAWITIPGTQLDYPVMAPGDDPEFYLHRNFYMEDSYSGIPFLDANADISSENVLIYGHNMKNGTMFATLISYMNKDFWEAHPLIYMDSEEGAEVYEIFAAFREEIHGEKDQVAFKYYNYGGNLGARRFETYVGSCLRASEYKTGINAAYGDKLLTLSTCYNFIPNGRFVVVARKVEFNQ